MSYAVGIVGATGMVGAKITECLDQRGFPVDYRRSKLFASERNSGFVRRWGGHPLVLNEAKSVADFVGLDIVFLSAGGDATKSAVSQALCPMVTEAGAVAIDNSSAWRMDPDVPLVVAEVNAHELENRPKGIVANPNCTTMIAAPVLAALRDVCGLKAVSVATYQSVSGQGLAGVREAIEQIEGMIPHSQQIIDGTVFNAELKKPNVFPGRVGFNALPLAGEMVGADTTEEQKFDRELRKILELPDLPVAATCVRVPVLNGHSMVVSVELEERLETAEAVMVLTDAPGVRLVDVPTSLDASGKDDVLVGRLRSDPTRQNGLQFFVSGDNLLKGAALNAVQLAELIVR